MNTLQDPGEKASTYLCRLQAALNLAVKRGGAAAEKANRHILKQCCHGCWNTLLSDLYLEEKKSHPPAFSELLLLIRTEEDRQAAKATRMKKHLGSHQQRAMASSHSASFQPESNPLTELKQQVVSLQSQFTMLIRPRRPKGTLSIHQVGQHLNLTLEHQAGNLPTQRQAPSRDLGIVSTVARMVKSPQLAVTIQTPLLSMKKEIN
ncbi:hypothetical protein N1851_008391 [Merluccius polli]|uniref:Paraneoplastic antigen Ma-like C-terminal domain-containing protein n=1 Tax=Merluccius polli TaxID=89951 RepID=A0AA47N2M0_MERPO|nr:hypothetical protein N1851_008391 [Merluccius polli]